MRLPRNGYRNVGCPSIRNLSIRNIYYQPRNFQILHDFITAAQALSQIELQFIRSPPESELLQEVSGNENYVLFEDDEIREQFGDINSPQQLFRATVYAPLSQSHKPCSIAIQDVPLTEELATCIDTNKVKELSLRFCTDCGVLKTLAEKKFSLRLETLIFIILYNEFKWEKLDDNESRSPYCTYAKYINKHSISLKSIALHELAGSGIDRELLYPGEIIVAKAKALLPTQVSLTVETDPSQAGPILGAPLLPPTIDQRIEFSAEDISSFSFATVELLHIIPHNWAFITEVRILGQEYFLQIDQLLKDAANDLIRSYQQFGSTSPALKYLVVGVHGQRELVFRVSGTSISNHGRDYYGWEPLLSVENQEKKVATLEQCPIFALYPKISFEPTHSVNRPFGG
ncbi:uncharacterized protein DFL_005464 [Arthrobotrys flagrans]|uniref:Uncharacterized protein n=1 Tax=Arthrobotrys flagrans TaxID=97331 RepID=A0A436ZY72_ARTFL|nr:hypothetical protein DFL_005464 [Arthrobotrys flagrans]